MPPNDDGALDKAKEVLTKKYGPLPGWAWVAVGVAGYYLYRNFAGAASGEQITPGSIGDEAGFIGGGGGGGGNGSTPAPEPEPSPDPIPGPVPPPRQAPKTHTHPHKHVITPHEGHPKGKCVSHSHVRISRHHQPGPPSKCSIPKNKGPQNGRAPSNERSMERFSRFLPQRENSNFYRIPQRQR